MGTVFVLGGEENVVKLIVVKNAQFHEYTKNYRIA